MLLYTSAELTSSKSDTLLGIQIIALAAVGERYSNILENIRESKDIPTEFSTIL